MRFQRRIKIAPGLRLNVSKSGLGFSVGPRGASFSVGPSGVYSHVGLPGTGISHRSKISSGQSSQGFRPTGETVAYSVKMEDDGIVVILGPNREQVTDESTIRKLKRTEAYKNAVQELSQTLKAQLDEKSSSVVNLYKNSDHTLGLDSWHSAIDSLMPATYSIVPFNKDRPTESEIRTTLYDESQWNVKTWKFWQKKRLRQEYVNENVDARLRQEIDEWENDRSIHDSKESEIKRAKDAEFLAAYNTAKSELQAAIDGNQSFIEQCLEDLFGGMNMPFDFSVDYQVNGSEVRLDLDLPEIEEMPIEKATILASGKVKVAEKSKKELRSDYVCCVLGLGYYAASGVFNISPKISSVLISAYTQRPDKTTGQVIDDYIYSIKFTRQEFSEIIFTNLDPVAGLSRFTHEIKLSKTFELSSVTPISEA
jgi:hypothetical protein